MFLLRIHLSSIVWLIVVSGVAGWSYESWAESSWSVERGDGSTQLMLDANPFATYVFRDAAISRPYFANVFEPSGVKITRNHPPAADDPQDHEKLHPGMWLAFGDISGADSWRLAAPIEHVRFVMEPNADGKALRFAVENKYLSLDDEEICREVCSYTFHALPDGVLALCDSTFRSENGEFVFGDQEELGLGVRLAKPVSVKSRQGGRILNSNGQRNEVEAWGQQADWCDYSGTVGNQFLGIMIMPHPKNFRQSWCHCRDTGFMAMNPFGRNAFTGGEKSAVLVSERETFRLRYGVLFHWSDKQSDFDPRREYNEFVRLTTDAH